MRSRTKAREYALQILYQIDLAHLDCEQTVEEFWTYHPAPPDVKVFATRLVRGTIEHLEEIDRLIAAHADNWHIHRMAVVDRNILRQGAFELLHLQEVPPKVCLNEAVELAKRFGDEESSKFVNGVLDAIHKQHAHQPDGQAAHEADRDADACASPVSPGEPPAASPDPSAESQPTKNPRPR